MSTNLRRDLVDKLAKPCSSSGNSYLVKKYCAICVCIDGLPRETTANYIRNHLANWVRYMLQSSSSHRHISLDSPLLTAVAKQWILTEYIEVSNITFIYPLLFLLKDTR